MADDFLRGLNLPQAVLFEDAAWTSPLTGFVASLMLTLLVGPVAIRLLRKFARESIKSDSERLNQLHAAKKETPTMGGLLIVATFVVSAAVAGMESPSVFWCVTLTAIALMMLGAADDWIKRATSRKGLTARQKLFGQILIAVVASMFLAKTACQVHRPDELHHLRILCPLVDAGHDRNGKRSEPDGWT